MTKFPELSKKLKDLEKRIKELEGEGLMVTKTVDAEVAAKDVNGDGHISKEEMEMDLEFKRKALEDADAMRDAQRKMAWFALAGMLLYPFAAVLAMWLGLDWFSKYLVIWLQFTLFQLLQ